MNQANYLTFYIEHYMHVCMNYCNVKFFRNIGRGRDHGTPPYHKVRTFFELESIRKDEFSGDNYKKLAELYKNLDYRY